MDRKERLLQAMLTEPTVEKAAAKAKIGKSTAYKYLSEDNFKTRLIEKKREVMAQITTRFQQEALKAIKVLSEVMTDKEAPEYARINAAKTVLDNAYKGLELEDIQVRISIIEKAMNEKEG